ncbi:MAG: alkaline phosphatase family protein [Terracidiphilus sp.]|jgi:hypothetical protein
MGYYDGNTVTALWNYAQRYAMSNIFFGSTFGTTVMGQTFIEHAFSSYMQSKPFLILQGTQSVCSLRNGAIGNLAGQISSSLNYTLIYARVVVFGHFHLLDSFKTKLTPNSG